MPEGKLVKDLIVLVVLLLLLGCFAGLLVRGVQVRTSLVYGPDHQEPLFVQGLDLLDSEGEREVRQRLPAAKIQHIIGGEDLLRFRPLLLGGGAHGREHQPIVVQPLIAPLLAEVGELLHRPVLAEPEPGFIAVLRFVGRGDHEGRPGVAGVKPGVREKAIVQDVLLFDGSHGLVLSSLNI